MSRSLGDQNPDNQANFIFDENNSVDDRLRELHKTTFGHDYKAIFKQIEWTPSHDLIRFQDTVNEIKAGAYRAEWKLIKIMMAHDLSLATAELLTGGLIFQLQLTCLLEDVPSTIVFLFMTQMLKRYFWE